MTGRHEKAQAFLASLADDSPQLPYEPSLLPELFAGTANDSSASLSSIATLVNRSQGLAAQVLQRANSAYYGLGSEISSLTRAMQVLGLNEVRAIILSLGLTELCGRLKLPPSFPLREIWEHQVLTAHIARGMASFAQDNLGEALPPPSSRATPDELYAAGLLHDLGKALVASRCPEDWLAINDLATREKLPFHAAEEAYWGLDHSVVGARILSFWQLPARLTELVGWHHAPLLVEKQHEHGVRLLAAANALACLAHEFRSGSVSSLPPEAAVLLPPTLDASALLEAVTPCFFSDTVREQTAWLTE